VCRKSISVSIGKLKASLSDLASKLHEYSCMLSYFESLATRLANSSDDDDDSCIICFEPMTRLTVTPCQHYFCHSCITTCLKANGLCPTCRRAIRLNELVEVKLSIGLQLVLLVVTCRCAVRLDELVEVKHSSVSAVSKHL